MSGPFVIVRCYEELNQYLPAECAKKDFSHPCRPGMTLGDLLGELGVPESEVDLALIDGESVGLGIILRGGERVSLYPIFESLDIREATGVRPVPLRLQRGPHLYSLHPWNLSPVEARELQIRLRERVVARDALGEIRFVAGMDVGFESDGSAARAAVALLRFPDLSLAEHAVARKAVEFPYVPGLLSFREAPAILEALGRLRRTPDLLICDGQGYAHPRRFGLACHLGVIADIPSIGAAKSRLIGTHARLPQPRGSWVPLLDGAETVGAVLRTRSGVSPLFVSIGHRISLETAIRYVLRCAPRYRLPETTRCAHRLASGS